MSMKAIQNTEGTAKSYIKQLWELEHIQFNPHRTSDGALTKRKWTALSRSWLQLNL